MEKQSIKDSLGHFFGRVIARRNPQEMRFLQKFFGLSDNESLYVWGRKQGSPIGLRLVKGIFILDLIGYQMNELEDLPPEVWRLVSIVSLEKANVEEVSESLGYSQKSELFRLIFGKRAISDKMLKDIKLFVGNWSGDLSFDLPDSFAFYFIGLKPSVQSQVETRLKLSRETTSKLVDNLSPIDLDLLVSLIQVVGASTKVLEPQLDRLAKSDPSVRHTFRNLLENREAKTSLFSISNQVYRLSQMLNALCSEKSLAQSKNV
ncbi:MAG: hypothetical protein WC441_02845 [Patescibacteria group bacterium]